MHNAGIEVHLFLSAIPNVNIPVMTLFYNIAIEEAAAVCLLPLLLKEKGGNPEDFIKICRVSQILMILNLHVIISKTQLFIIMDGASIFTRECNETGIAGGEKALTRSIAHSIL